MNDESIARSALKLERFYFDECVYHRNASQEIADGKFQYKYSFTREITKADDQHYAVALRCNVIDPNFNSFELHVRAVGEFEITSEDAEEKKHMLCRNALTVLFPMLRSQIILMTAQIGSPQIILPIINVAKMFSVDELPGEE